MYVAIRGVIYRTMDGIAYEEFWRTKSPAVTSMCVYMDALFVGTSPDGLILFHNFNTGFRCTYVVTGDYSVSAMVSDDAVLYAATFPSGEVLSFNGKEWNKIYESNTDVSSVCIHGGVLYLFSHGDGAVRVYSSGKWTFMEDGGVPFAVGVKNMVSPAPSMVDPSAETGLSSSASFGGLLYFTGDKKPVVYSYDGKDVTVVYKFGGGTIGSMSVSDGQLFISVGDSLYVMQEVLRAD